MGFYIKPFLELFNNTCFKAKSVSFSRYDDDDYNKFATRDPWADLSAKQSTAVLPTSTTKSSTGGKQVHGMITIRLITKILPLYKLHSPRTWMYMYRYILFITERNCAPVVRRGCLESWGPGFKTSSNHLLNLFLVVPGSTSQLLS